MRDINVGVVGCGDNLIRKVLDSAGSVEGIKIVAIADKYDSIDSALEELNKRTNDDETPMYTGKLAENMGKLKDMVVEGKVRYFSVDSQNFEADFFGGIDGVHISTPNETHAYYAVLAARYHKHILCEKPFVETHRDAVDTISKINKARKPKDIAQICAVHYLRYGPSREFLEYLSILDDPIQSITANFIEDRSYLNSRTRAQFSRRGAIHDMVVHYVALQHKMGATIIPKEDGTKIFRLKGYKNETAVISDADIYGVHFLPEASVRMEAAKGAKDNCKVITLTFGNGRMIELNYLPGKLGIKDSSGEEWWDVSNIKKDPFVRIYEEFRDEIRRLEPEFSYGGGIKVVHTLEDSLLDQIILDKMRNIAREFTAKEYYGTQSQFSQRDIYKKPTKRIE